TIVVKTDSAGVIDADQADNNQLSSAALLVSLRPRPDLQIVGGTAPETVTAGAVIDVSWTVANLGPAATAIGGSRWNDAVFLSLNPTLDGGDLLLGTRQNGSSLAPGANYTTTATFTLPREIAGNAYIIVVPDRGDAIDEMPTTGSDYYVMPIAIDALPVPPADLVMTNVTAPSEAFDGTSMVVRYRVENRGPGVTGTASWTDTIWLTTDKDRPNPGAQDISLGSVTHHGVLQPGEGYEGSATVRLPPEVRGQYYIMVW